MSSSDSLSERGRAKVARDIRRSEKKAARKEAAISLRSRGYDFGDSDSDTNTDYETTTAGTRPSTDGAPSVDSSRRAGHGRKSHRSHRSRRTGGTASTAPSLSHFTPGAAGATRPPNARKNFNVKPPASPKKRAGAAFDFGASAANVQLSGLYSDSENGEGGSDESNMLLRGGASRSIMASARANALASDSEDDSDDEGGNSWVGSDDISSMSSSAGSDASLSSVAASTAYTRSNAKSGTTRGAATARGAALSGFYSETTGGYTGFTNATSAFQSETSGTSGTGYTGSNMTSSSYLGSDATTGAVIDEAPYASSQLSHIGKSTAFGAGRRRGSAGPPGRGTGDRAEGRMKRKAAAHAAARERFMEAERARLAKFRLRGTGGVEGQGVNNNYGDDVYAGGYDFNMEEKKFENFEVVDNANNHNFLRVPAEKLRPHHRELVKEREAKKLEKKFDALYQEAAVALERCGRAEKKLVEFRETPAIWKEYGIKRAAHA